MRHSHRLVLTATAALAAAPAPAQAAEALHGLTRGNVLVTFQSDNVASMTSRAIQGLPAGEQLVGLDVRPADDRLYALGLSSRLYVLDPATGRAFTVGATGFSPSLLGRTFGFDFNPTVDRIRIVSDQEQNLRVNPADGVATKDADLKYAQGDPGAAGGIDPAVGSAAYTNSVLGATATTLYVIDDTRGVLATQMPANDGTLRTVGPLGGRGPVTSFDIGNDNIGYAIRRNGLALVNLMTGAATSPVPVPTAQPLRAIAAAGVVPDDTRRPGLVAVVPGTAGRRLTVTGACDEACTVRVRVAGRSVQERVARTAGSVRVRVPLAARLRGRTVRVEVRATDGAGNTRTLVRRTRVR